MGFYINLELERLEKIKEERTMDIQKIRETALACYDGFSEEQKEKAFAIFEAMDSDGSGTVSRDEYEEYFGSSGRCSFQDLDVDGDGSLDFEEFITLFYVMMTSKGVSTTQPLIIIPQDQPKSLVQSTDQPKPSQSNQASLFVGQSVSQSTVRSDNQSIRQSDRRVQDSQFVGRSDNRSVSRSDSQLVSRFDNQLVSQSDIRFVSRSESLGSVSILESRLFIRSDSRLVGRSDSRFVSRSRPSKTAVVNAIEDFNTGWSIGTTIATVATGAASLCTIV